MIQVICPSCDYYNKKYIEETEEKNNGWEYGSDGDFYVMVAQRDLPGHYDRVDVYVCPCCGHVFADKY